MEKEEVNSQEIISGVKSKDEPLGIRVKTMDSTEVLVKAFPSDTILKLKTNISEKINLEANR